MELLEACPKYVYENWQVVDFFNEGMSPSTKKMVEGEGSLLDMAPEEAMEFLEFLADTSRKWEEYQLQGELTPNSDGQR